MERAGRIESCPNFEIGLAGERFGIQQNGARHEASKVLERARRVDHVAWRGMERPKLNAVFFRACGERARELSDGLF